MQHPLQPLPCCHERKRHDGALADSGAEDGVCLRGDATGVPGAADSQVLQDLAGPLQQHAFIKLGWWYRGPGERDVWVRPDLTQGQTRPGSSPQTELPEDAHTHTHTNTYKPQPCTTINTHHQDISVTYWTKSLKLCAWHVHCQEWVQSVSTVRDRGARPRLYVSDRDALSWSPLFCQGACSWAHQRLPSAHLSKRNVCNG